MTRIPAILLPQILIDPKIGDPAWMLAVPHIHRLRHGGAITLDTVRFRDALGNYWTCPRGFFTDGASVPWLLRWLWSNFDPKTIRPAIIHDLRYCLHDYFPAWHKIDKQVTADRDFLAGMKLDCPSRAHTYYVAVRMFGRAVYEHIDKEKIMLAWFDMIQQPDYILDAWIQGMIAGDR
jgi:hypothetical protein